MAGGTWEGQNEVRAGAYINFVPVRKSPFTVGDRGIVAIPMELPWGKEGQLIEINGEDFGMGYTKKDIGLTASDEESKLLIGALSYAYQALVYRLNKGGNKANVTIGDLKVEAKYSGTFGNKIKVAITQDEVNELFTVITYVDGVVVNSQVVAEISELEANNYVTFTDNTENDSGELEATAGASLTGGTDGTTTESTAYAEFESLLTMAKWQTMACFSTSDVIKGGVQTFIKSMRDDEGRYVQGVVCDYDGADYEGIINSISSAIINGVTYSKSDFVSIVAGMTAGANVNESNTAKVITGATKIIDELAGATEIKRALNAGKFFLSTSTSGKIKVEQDINSLHTYYEKRSKTFSKNRVIRALDEIGTTVKQVWEDTYMGKVDNNENGRGLFKSDLVEYGMELERLSAISNFGVGDDIDVKRGTDPDSVLVDWAVQPVDAMEKLYMTIVVS